MTPLEIRQIIREELAAFFASVAPQQGKFDADLNLLAAEGPQALQRLCKERMKRRSVHGQKN